MRLTGHQKTLPKTKRYSTDLLKLSATSSSQLQGLLVYPTDQAHPPTQKNSWTKSTQTRKSYSFPGRFELRQRKKLIQQETENQRWSKTNHSLFRKSRRILRRLKPNRSSTSIPKIAFIFHFAFSHFQGSSQFWF